MSDETTAATPPVDYEYDVVFSDPFEIGDETAPTLAPIIKPINFRALPGGGLAWDVPPASGRHPIDCRAAYLDPAYVAAIPADADKATVARQIYEMTDRPVIDTPVGGPQSFSFPAPAGIAKGKYVAALVSRYTKTA